MASEKRLIYLEDAIAKIVNTPSVVAERVFDGQYGHDQNPAVLVDRQFEVIDLLNEVPEVDAVEVVHGRWELYGDDDDLSGSYFCSNCGYNMDEAEYLDNFSHFNYCLNCGAKMDGDENG